MSRSDGGVCNSEKVAYLLWMCATLKVLKMVNHPILLQISAVRVINSVGMFVGDKL